MAIGRPKRGRAAPQLRTGGVADGWDSVNTAYLAATERGRDPLRHDLMVPTILSLLGAKCAGKRVVDLGCGPGGIAAELLARGAASVLGIDSSEESVRVSNESGVSGFHAELHDIEAPLETISDFDIAIASMVLHLVRDLETTIENIAHLLRPGGLLVVALPHPIFHADTEQIRNLSAALPTDRGANCLPTVPYDENREVVNTFGVPPVHVHMVHRPISRYLQAFAGQELRLVDASEPTFRAELPSLQSAWNVAPPFVFFVLER